LHSTEGAPESRLSKRYAEFPEHDHDVLLLLLSHACVVWSGEAADLEII
jgi:hypothetical protein